MFWPSLVLAPDYIHIYILTCIKLLRKTGAGHIDLCSNFLKTSHKSSFNFNNLLKRQILKTAVILEQCHLLADWKNCKPSAWLIFLVMAMTRSISDVPISMQLTLIN